MQDLPKGLPVDAAEYLVSAAEEVANEQGFKPNSPEEMSIWLTSNFQEIATRANELQISILNKIATPEGKKVIEIMACKVWTEIRHRADISEANAGIEKALGGYR